MLSIKNLVKCKLITNYSAFGNNLLEKKKYNFMQFILVFNLILTEWASENKQII